LVGKEEKVRKVKAIPGEEVMMRHRLIVMGYILQKVSECTCSSNKQGKVVEVEE